MYIAIPPQLHSLGNPYHVTIGSCMCVTIPLLVYSDDVMMYDDKFLI